MKSVIKFFLLLLISHFSIVAVGQSDNGKYIEFKLYKNAQFELGQTQATRVVTLGTFSPAIAWGENANFHEIQLTSINFKSRAQAFSYSAGAEYTYNHRFSDNEGRLKFYFGGGVGGGFSTSFSTLVSSISGNTINTTGKDILVHFLVIPRITYEIRPTILLDVSLPYHVYDFKNTRFTADDPSLPSNQRTNTINTSTFLPRVISLKVGGIVLF